MSSNKTKIQILQWIRIVVPSLIYLGVRALLKAVSALSFQHNPQFSALPEVLELAGMAVILFALGYMYLKRFPLIRRTVPELLGIILVSLVPGFFLGWLFGQISSDTETSGTILSFLTICLIGPACEEIIYRGMTYHSTDKLAGSTAAILVSTLLFACGHSSFLQMGCAIPVGLILGFLRKKTGDVFSPLILHWTINIVTFIL